MNKQDFMKLQSCVLRVNVDCDGCKQKVKKVLHKIDDVEQGKVTVTGNVDPAILIRKLEKLGKQAQLWGPQKGSNNYQSILNNQFKDNNKSQKGGGNSNHMNQFPKGGHHHQQLQTQRIMLQQFKGGSKDMMKMARNKDQKQGKFNMFEDDFDDDDDDFDEYDDEFGHGHHFRDKNNAKGPHGMIMDVKKEGDGGNYKKGGAVIPFEMMGRKESKDGKNGKARKKGIEENNKGGKKNEGSKKDKNGGKSGGGFFGFGKKKGGKDKNSGGLLRFGKRDKDGGESGNKNGSGADGKNKRNGGLKKGGGKNDYDGVFDMKKMKDDVFDFDVPNLGGKGGKANGNANGAGGKNMGQMGNYPMGRQMGGFPAVQGLPASAAMNGVYYQGMGPGNPYDQQYMGMMMNQQRMNGNEMYHPMMYARQQPPVNYGAPQPMPGPAAAANYIHFFSDENANSCSIM